MKRKKDEDVLEEIFFDSLGNEIHVFDDGITRIAIKDSPSYTCTGQEWCPECHIQLEHKNEYWECPDCGWTILDEESENGEGYQTKESTYEFDWGCTFDKCKCDSDDDFYENL